MTNKEIENLQESLSQFNKDVKAIEPIVSRVIDTINLGEFPVELRRETCRTFRELHRKIIGVLRDVYIIGTKSTTRDILKYFKI